MPFNPVLVWSMVIGATFFWGSNFNAAHAVVGLVAPLTACAERFVLAMLVFLAIRLWRGSAESRLSGQEKLALILLGLLGVFGFNYSFFVALETTSALNAALIMALSPLLTMLLSSFILTTGLPVRQLLGIAIAFSGVALVITGGHLSLVRLAPGDLWMLFACFCWSLHNVLVKRYAGAVPPMQQARWTISTGTMGMIILVLLIDSPLETIPNQPISSIGALIYMAIFGTVLAYVFWLQGIQKLGPQRAAVAFNLVPVSTLLINLVMGQLPQIEQFVGLALVFSGVVITTGMYRLWMPKKAPV